MMRTVLHSGAPGGRRAGAAMILAATLLGLAACTGSSDGTDGSPAAASAVAPTGTASTYPVPPSASPVAEPTLAVGNFQNWTLALTGVRRLGADQISVEGVLSGAPGTPIQDKFTEGGFYLRDRAGATNPVVEFSAVQLTVKGDPVVYLPMRDAENNCACTELDWPGGNTQGGSIGLYVVMTAPSAATTVDIRVAGFPVFRDVPVSA